MKKTHPFYQPPSSRPLLDEHYTRKSISNPRSRIQAQVGLIICLLLSTFVSNDETSYVSIAISEKKSRIPDFALVVHGDGNHTLTSSDYANRGKKVLISPSSHRRCIKKRKGPQFSKSRSSWRLGLVTLVYYSTLFKWCLWGATATLLSRRVSRLTSMDEEQRVEVLLLLWNDCQKLRAPKYIRSSLFLFDNANCNLSLLAKCQYWLAYILSQWVCESLEYTHSYSYSDFSFSKEQPTKENSKESVKELTTMASQALKGSESKGDEPPRDNDPQQPFVVGLSEKIICCTVYVIFLLKLYANLIILQLTHDLNWCRIDQKKFALLNVQHFPSTFLMRIMCRINSKLTQAGNKHNLREENRTLQSDEGGKTKLKTQDTQTEH